MYDGTGAPARRADVLVRGGRIADVAADIPPDPGGEPAEILEATGLAVAPGFIDLHSHGDLVHALPPASQGPLMQGRLAQGITTEIVGNCGLGVFPCAAPALPLMRAVIEWMTPPEAADWPWDAWSALGAYLDRLERQGTWVNVGALQPHGPLRLLACGLERDAGPEALDRMERDLDEALQAGAFGMSTGLIYPPGMYSPPAELTRLARRVAGATGGTGLVASHIRGSSETLIPAVQELLDLGAAAGVRVQHSHNEAVGRHHWPRIDQVLVMEDAARARGIDVAHDMFPYTAAATMMLAIYPPWALEGGVHRLLQRLSIPGERAAIGRDIASVEPRWPAWTSDGWPHNLVRAVGWDLITIGCVGSPGNRPLEGMSLTELGRARGRAPFDAISDLMIEERGNVSQIIHGVSGEEGHEEGIEALLSHPAASVCTDANDYGKGKPHPAACGAFVRALGRYARQRRLFTMEEAIRRMTSAPAARLGLGDRGVVRAGAWADLVVFDPLTVGSDATFAEPRRPVRGIRWVFVNGSPTYDAARPAEPNQPAGKVLRRGG